MVRIDSENELLEELKIDKELVLKRFSGNVELFFRFLNKFSDDQTYGELCKAREDGDFGKMEMSAHTLKGVAGNLGLEKLSVLSGQLLTTLRAGECEMIEETFQKLTEEYLKNISTLNRYSA